MYHRETAPRLGCQNHKKLRNSGYPYKSITYILVIKYKYQCHLYNFIKNDWGSNLQTTPFGKSLVLLHTALNRLENFDIAIILQNSDEFSLPNYYVVLPIKSCSVSKRYQTSCHIYQQASRCYLGDELALKKWESTIRR